MPSELKRCPNPWCKRGTLLVESMTCGPAFVACTCGVRGPTCGWESGEENAKSEAVAAWNKRINPAHDRLVAALKEARSTLVGITESDWRKWEELASCAEFERWAKSRTNHETAKIDAILRELGEI